MKTCIDCGQQLIKQSAKRCKRCFYNWYKKEKRSNWSGGKPKCIDCDSETKMYKAIRCIKCWHQYAIGENATNYIDGNSKNGYTPEFTKKLRQEIRERNNYKCSICNMTEEEHLIVYGQQLSVHHIDYDKENCDKDNLATVCLGCNNRINYNKKYWTDFFHAKIHSV